MRRREGADYCGVQRNSDEEAASNHSIFIGLFMPAPSHRPETAAPNIETAAKQTYMMNAATGTTLH